MQNRNNGNTQKKSDGFINLSVVFTDNAGREHNIKAPIFGLSDDDALHKALLDKPELAEHLTITVDSIRRAKGPVQADDLDLNFG
jgi:hypothetical protein